MHKSFVLMALQIVSVFPFMAVAQDAGPVLPVIVAESNGSTAVTEKGPCDTVTVRLASIPAFPVTVVVTPGGSAVDAFQINGTTPGLGCSLEFNALTWDQPQTLTLCAIDDGIAESTQTARISFTVQSDDPAFNNAAIPAVTVTIYDAGGQVCPTADRTGDCRVGLDDLLLVATKWMTGDTQADLSGNGKVEIGDLAVLSENWQRSAGPVVINEILAWNASVAPLDATELLDEDGESSDWIELTNISSQPQDIGGWWLTNDPGKPNRWQIPSPTVIQSGKFLIIFASGKNRQVAGKELHTDFGLNRDGAYLALVGPDGQTVVHEFVEYEYDNNKFGYPSQAKNISYGLIQGKPFYLATPSPRAVNANSFPGFVEQPRMSVEHGLFDQPFTVSLTTDTPGATIKYTTDFTAPSLSNGTTYTPGALIPINKTTCLRAAAFKAPYRPSPYACQTYIFLSNILAQSASPAGFPSGWDYAMDSRVVTLNQATIRDDFKSIPTMSLVFAIPDLFGASGIYSNYNSTGAAWERPCSLELIYPDGSKGFQVNCGARLYGGVGRQTAKKSFRVVFKSAYGPTKLEYPLFGDETTDQFDNIVLRSVFNDAYVWGGSSSQYIRDEVVRRYQLAMGDPAPYGMFVHLYINGLYWGLYNPCERPDAAFSASYFGGEKEEWDGLNSYPRNVVDGTDAAWLKAQSLASSGVASPSGYKALSQYVDMDNLANYMLLNFYVGNNDWDDHNWYAGRRRIDGAGYKFYTWDAEWVMGMNSGLGDNRLGVNQSQKPSYLYNALKQNTDFRMILADKAYKAFFNDGPFFVDASSPDWNPAYPERNRPAAVYAYWASVVERAMNCELARWGDVVGGLFTIEQWRSMRDWVLHTYCPQRSAIVLQQLKSHNPRLYPSFDPPQLWINNTVQRGGYASPGASLTMAGGTQKIYYTTDGTDPRTWSKDSQPTGQEFILFPETATKWVTIPTQPVEPTKGTILMEYWTGIGGTAVSDLTSNPNYPANPSGSQSLTSFASPVNWNDQYGVRISGLLYPPTTGTYTFWVAGDDNCELWLSTDENSANAVRIALVPGWTEANEWYWYTEQQSVAITLTAGKKYYIEGLMKEDGGGDSLSAAWSCPAAGIAGPIVIAGQYLSPATSNWTSVGFDHSSWTQGTGGVGYENNPGSSPNYTSLINIDMKTPMYGKNTSCYIRIPFTVQGQDIAALALNIRYDDGFVAYLNGTEVKRVNLADGVVPQWNTAANAGHDDNAAISLESFNLTPYVSKIRQGQNILAIQGLDTAGSSDFLISAELKVQASSSSGEIAPTAVEYTGSITLNRSQKYKIRAYNPTTLEWSALDETAFGVGPVQESLRITELMFHPADPNLEFLEFKNIGEEAINLNLVRFTHGVDYTFGDTTLAPGGFALLVENAAEFEAKYGAGFPVVGQYVGSLENAGEKIELVDATGAVIQSFTYKDGWYPITDGAGFSLTLRNLRPDSSAIPAEGLVSLWQMDETAGTAVPDSQGTHPGQTVNMDNANWVSGRLDHGLQFDGIDEFVTIPGYKGILGGASRTVSLWLQTTDRTDPGQLVGWGIEDFGQKWVVRLWPKDVNRTVLRVEVWGAPIVGTTDLADGKWHHVAATLADDGSPDVSEVILYVDGRRETISLVGQQAVNTAAGNDLRLGVFTTPYFQGRMDQVAIYDRALTATEVRSFFDQGAPWNDKIAWRPSSVAGGTPGADDTGTLPAPGSVVINEILSHSHLIAPDWIELHNTTNEPINIGGWFLSDSNADDPNRMKYEIAADTILPRNGYAVFYEDLHFGNVNDVGCHTPFGLSEGGETLYLQSGLDGNLTGYSVEQQFDAAESGVAFGRYIKSTLDGGVNFVAMSVNTPNDDNSAPKVGPIVFAEIQYNPSPANTGDEYIELKNISGQTVTLQDAVSTETAPGVFTTTTVPWQFTDGIDFVFPVNTRIPAGGLLIVAKNPAAFTAKYGAGITVLGPFANSSGLNNGGEKVRLSRPGDQEFGEERYWIRAEQVSYGDSSPWPIDADGKGKVLQRVEPTAYGNDAANWQAGDPTPGQ